MKKIITLAAISLATTAFAESKENTYVEFGYGREVSNQGNPFGNFSGTTSTNKKFSSANLGKIAVGHSFGEFRLEAEAFISNSTKARYTGTGTTTIKNMPQNGDSGTFTGTDWQESIKYVAGFVNAYYDIDTMGNGFRPYIGAGIGVARVSSSITAAQTATGFTSATTNTTNTTAPANGDAAFTAVRKNGVNFAFNLAAGVIYDINDQFYINLGYKYLNLGKARSVIDTTKVAAPAANQIGAFQKGQVIQVRKNVNPSVITIGLGIKF